MRIQHNISALNSHRNLGANNISTSRNLEKLSSGYRINRAGDDAAGLAISEKMRGQIRGLAMAEQNTSNGINLIQTAEGGLNETHAILQRMRELAVQSSNGTYQDEDRIQITKEFEALKKEVTRIAESTHYNGIKLLDGNLAKTQLGAAGATSDKMSAVLTDFDTGIISSTDFTAAGSPTETATVEIALDDDGNLRFSDTTGNYDVALTAGKITLTDKSDGGKTLTAASDLDEDSLKELLANAKDNKISFDLSAAGAMSNTAVEVHTADSHTGLSDAGVSIALDSAATPASGSYNVSIEKGNDGKYTVSVGNQSTKVDFAALSTGVKVNGLEITVDSSKEEEFKQAVSDGAFEVKNIEVKNLFTTNDDFAVDFQNTKVSNGSGLVFQIGANGGEDQRVSLSVENMDAMSIGLLKGAKLADGTVLDKDMMLSSASVETIEGANMAIEVITGATNMVSGQRAELGALQNRLEHTLNNLGTTKENLTAAESSIRDVDMAKEMMEFTKNNILVQASQAMLAQANQLPQGVLQLLR